MLKYYSIPVWVPTQMKHSAVESDTEVISSQTQFMVVVYMQNEY